MSDFEGKMALLKEERARVLAMMKARVICLKRVGEEPDRVKALEELISMIEEE